MHFKCQVRSRGFVDLQFTLEYLDTIVTFIQENVTHALHTSYAGYIHLYKRDQSQTLEKRKEIPYYIKNNPTVILCEKIVGVKIAVKVEHFFLAHHIITFYFLAVVSNISGDILLLFLLLGGAYIFTTLGVMYISHILLDSFCLQTIVP